MSLLSLVLHLTDGTTGFELLLGQGEVGSVELFFSIKKS